MNYSRSSITRYGIRWYCQTAGKHWATDPMLGLHLKYDAKTDSWWLHRDGRLERADTDSNYLKPAMNRVGQAREERAHEQQQGGRIQRPDR